MPSTSNKEKRGDAKLTTIKVCLGGEIVDIPSKLLDSEDLLRSVLRNGYPTVSEHAKDHLRRFLVAGNNVDEDVALKCAFTADNNFCFGNPVSNVFKRFKGGYFSPPHTADEVQLRDHRRVLYDHYIRNYYMNLLKVLLSSRHAIMEKAYGIGAVEELTPSAIGFHSKRKLKTNRQLRERAGKRVKLMIGDCRRKVGEVGCSSDDSEDEKGEQQILPLVPNAESTLYHPQYTAADLDLHQPTRLKSVKELLKEYRRLRETEPECPSLDISDITLEEVYDRAGIAFQSERNFAQTIRR
jgi:hypothetical protein